MQYQFDWVGIATGVPVRWLLAGFVNTLTISFISIVLAMALGIVVSAMRVSGFKPLVWLSAAYVEFFRNTPLLVQIFFWYFSYQVVLPTALADWINTVFVKFAYVIPKTPTPVNWFVLSAETVSCIIALTVYTAAFIAEEIRAGIFSIPKNQLEASRATGLTFIQAYRYVILPQAIRIVIPPLISQFLNLIKNSSLCMVIGVGELAYQATQIESYFGRAFEGFTYATLIYLIISLTVSFVITMYNKHFMLQVRY
ncbi:MAG: amino acid ABC transporter permease [Desulfovibrionaceae bacterium]